MDATDPMGPWDTPEQTLSILQSDLNQRYDGSILLRGRHGCKILRLLDSIWQRKRAELMPGSPDVPFCKVAQLLKDGHDWKTILKEI